MLIVVSPAKTLDYETPVPTTENTQPRFLPQSAELVDILKQQEPWRLSELMGISDELATLNANRYQSWSLPFDGDNARQALFAFKGDVYTGLDAYSLSQGAINTAQRQLRILSGLYGVLRPLDLMQPYRLEMGTRLQNPKGANLYRFWGDTLTQSLNEEARETGADVLINLASNEYYKAVNEKKLAVPVITPVFLDMKGGKYKVVSFWAKKARGMMTRYILQNQLQRPEDIKSFDTDGYSYNPALSDGAQWAFTRDH
ncbi:peroxide stress protein YaaA [Hahella aquimaris]|uniref:peroxide stress protein YaaA n=1 Tax=Hahella sp. HNIBRBA332 TaxID=3015983 RepID=UPI00273AC2B9|nr:peroxide stress protein YaaA [Hahella sp. HNIBRBA332]WLQ15041.1 peroxide stress protein YaaA [Hahella sp. HNIBRBA332]